MDDLLAAVKAELDEDEAAAKAAAQSGNQFMEPGSHDPRWQRITGHNGGEIRDMCEPRRGCVVVFDEGAPSAEQAAHIARHDPARALREVAAMRKLIAYAIRNAEDADGEWGDGHSGAEIASGQCEDRGAEALHAILGPLAAIYGRGTGTLSAAVILSGRASLAGTGTLSALVQDGGTEDPSRSR